MHGPLQAAVLGAADALWCAAEYTSSHLQVPEQRLQERAASVRQHGSRQALAGGGIHQAQPVACDGGMDTHRGPACRRRPHKPVPGPPACLTGLLLPDSLLLRARLHDQPRNQQVRGLC